MLPVTHRRPVPGPGAWHRSGIAAAGVDIEAAGLDTAYPAIILSLLVGEVRTLRHFVVAVAGATIAVGGSLVLPAGLPLMATAAAALLGLVGYREEGR